MTDKERLEEIKEIYRWAIESSIANRIADSDIEWLINQAERVQEVEEELKELRAMYSVVNGERIRYKHALEFYADEENYCVRFEDDYEPILQDNGKTARQALEGTE